MNAVIVTIGDEILFGHTIDTNSAFIARRLDEIGVGVLEIVSVHDDEQQIAAALKRAFATVDLVLTTGGLGPTKDDLTTQVVADFFEMKMTRNEQVLQDIQKLFQDSPPDHAAPEGLFSHQRNRSEHRYCRYPHHCHLHRG